MTSAVPVVVKIESLSSLSSSVFVGGACSAHPPPKVLGVARGRGDIDISI